MQSRWQASENAVTQMLQVGRSGMGCREGMPGRDGAHVVGGGVALPLDAARSGA